LCGNFLHERKVYIILLKIIIIKYSIYLINFPFLHCFKKKFDKEVLFKGGVVHKHEENMISPIKRIRDWFSERSNQKTSVTPKDLLTEKGFDRLVFFSDAVAAFALTLLITPLIELAADEDLVGGVISLHTIFLESWMAIMAFLISFFVVINLWHSHRRLFEDVLTVNSYISKLNTFWLLSLICIPFATQLISGNFIKLNMLFYMFVLMVNNLTLTLMYRSIRKNETVFKADDAEFRTISSRWSTLIILIFISVIIIIVPPYYGQFAIYLVFLKSKRLRSIQEKLIKKLRHNN
jgi:uncharacterized membrane protein